MHVPAFSRLTRPTKEACLLSIAACKSMRQFRKIQALLFRIHLHQDEDALNKSMVFCTDPSLGNFSYAGRIFSTIRRPNLFVHNVIMKALANKRMWSEILLLYGRLKEAGLIPDNFTYPFVLKAIGCLQKVMEAGKVHGYITKSGADGYACKPLMDMYGKFGDVEHAVKVFEEMREPDVVSWNILIAVLLGCGRHHDAVGVFSRLRLEGSLKPDEATFVSTLSVCVALKFLEFGKKIQGCIIKELAPTAIISNALLNMYSKCGCLTSARKIFDAVPIKNVICWTSIVSGCVNSGLVDEARDLFDRIPVRDIILWTAMINGYVQFKRFDEAVALFRAMQAEGIRPDKFTLVALLTGCSQEGALEQGKWIHGYIEEVRLPIDTVVGTALMEMYAKCGCIEKSMEIFRGLQEKDTPSWSSIICGLAMNGKTSEALKLFTEMNQAGASPDDTTFIGVLCACSHGGLVEEGRQHFNSMRTMFQIEPKVEHYGCMVDLLGRGGLLDEAEMLIGRVPNADSKMAVPFHGALLNACRIHGNVEMAKRLSQRILRVESYGVHTLLANLYASLERWEEVEMVRGKMSALGMKKLPGCSSIEINGIVHEFVVGDASHPETKDICFLLDLMFKPLSSLDDIGKDESVLGQ